MPVIDCTGDNARCYRCKDVVGKKIVSYNNIWLCKKCFREEKEGKKEEKLHKEKVRRKMKKGKRTAKMYIKDRLEGNPGVDFSTEELAQELIDEYLTKKKTSEDAKSSVSIIISGLRKENFPIEKTGRGVYRWRSKSGLTKKEEEEKEKEEKENLLFGE